MKQQPDEGPRKPQGSPYRVASVGFEIAVPVVLLMFAGYKLDGWIDSQPWFLLIGALLGIAIGFYTMFKRLLPPKDGPDGTQR